jgi:hypothetical protein
MPPMPLTLRPIKWPGTGPAYRQKFPDYDVLHDGQIVGRIYRQMAAVSPSTEWYWAINGVPVRPHVRGDIRVGATNIRVSAVPPGGVMLIFARASEVLSV